MTQDRERLDVLVQRLTGVSRSKAQGLIQTGAVRDAAGTPITKPGTRLPVDSELVIADERKFVSRGGEKLEAALDAWDVSPQDKVALDAGASTGGCTDCLLQHGARRVYAVDVGYGQLDWSLRNDPRVTVLERTNIRHASPELFDEQPSFFTADCSFISLRLVLPSLRAILAPNSEGIVLVKPQFEAGKDAVGKGGVVRDAAVHEHVLATVSHEAARLGYRWLAAMPSPLLGPAGNKEFLAHLRFDGQANTTTDA